MHLRVRFISHSFRSKFGVGIGFNDFSIDHPTKGTNSLFLTNGGFIKYGDPFPKKVRISKISSQLEFEVLLTPTHVSFRAESSSKWKKVSGPVSILVMLDDATA